MYKEKIFNIQTGEETWRDYTKDEIILAEKLQKEATERTEVELQKQTIRQSALAKLAALGLTEEEIAAL
jgi:DNA-binding NarL/FixJ family response regulator